MNGAKIAMAGMLNRIFIRAFDFDFTIEMAKINKPK